MRHLPNLLSLYRILMFPVILYAIFQGWKNLFVTLLLINLVTDILDGFIARRFNLQTELGTKLDSIADIGSYLLAVTGMIVLEYDFVHEHQTAFILLIAGYLAPQLIALIRFQETTSYHLYTSKLTAYIQGSFLLVYFAIGYVSWYFYLMIIVSCLSYLEELIITMYIPQLRSNVKGIYFILKKHKRIV